MKTRKRQIAMYPIDEYESEEGTPFPQETLEGLAGLCTILKSVRNRLFSEGYTIVNGKLFDANNNNEVEYQIYN